MASKHKLKNGRRDSQNLHPKRKKSVLTTTGRPSHPLGMRKQRQLTLNFRDSASVAPIKADTETKGGEKKMGESGRINTQSNNYWSSTTYHNNTSNAWNVNFNNGNVNNNDKTNNNYVRAVRSSKCQGSLPLFGFENIYRAYIDCRKRKRNTINALKFEINTEENLLRLERELENKTYSPSRSILFVINRPKLREIFAADFRDRIIHHILVSYLEKIWEPKFIYDSHACRKDKGTHKAVTRLQSFMRKVTRNGTSRAHYMQLDIHSFFVNIDKEILFDLIKEKVNNKDILWLARIVIFHDCTKNYFLKGQKELLKMVPSHKSLFNRENKKGLPIGNLTSQFFANVYLNELDQFVKHNLKIRYYIRYCDDFVILHNNKEQLQIWKGLIDEFLHTRLKLALNPRQQIIRPISNGINFLGYITRPNYLLVRRRVVNNLTSKLKIYEKWLVSRKDGYIRLNFDYPQLEALLATISSYLSHFKFANTHRLKNKIFADFPFLNEFFIYSNNFLIRRYKIQRDFRSLVAQYLFFRKMFPEDILFFQVGRFYEFYGREALLANQILGLKRVGVPRIFKLKCGFPIIASGKNLEIARAHGLSIAIISETDRYISRIKERRLVERWKIER